MVTLSALVTLVKLIVQVVALKPDWIPVSRCVMSSPAHCQKFFAVVPGVITIVAAPVVPEHVALPAHAPPAVAENVAQAPVPVTENVPPASSAVMPVIVVEFPPEKFPAESKKAAAPMFNVRPVPPVLFRFRMPPLGNEPEIER